MLVFRLLKRCRVRYSLRALGALMTVVCLWLGMLASSARQQRLATEQLRAVNATVGFGRQVSRVPRWIRDRIGDDFFLTVTDVQLSWAQNGRITSPLPLHDLKVAVGAISRLPNLRSIYFAHTGVHDDDLRHLSPLAKQIESLCFNEPWGDLTGEALKHLAGWPRLRELDIFSPNHLDSSTLNYLTALPALESLGWTGSLDDAAFENIARCRRLKTLSLIACTFDGQSLIKLRSATCLKSVALQNCTPEPVGIVKTTDELGKLISQSVPTSYRFRPMKSFMVFPGSPDAHYQKWLQSLLPGVTIYEGSSSN